LVAQFGGVLGGGDGVQIYQAEFAVVAVLEFDPVLDGAQVVAELGDACGLDAGEDACHGWGGGADSWGGQPWASRKRQRVKPATLTLPIIVWLLRSFSTRRSYTVI